MPWKIFQITAQSQTHYSQVNLCTFCRFWSKEVAVQSFCTFQRFSVTLMDQLHSYYINRTHTHSQAIYTNERWTLLKYERIHANTLARKHRRHRPRHTHTQLNTHTHVYWWLRLRGLLLKYLIFKACVTFDAVVTVCGCSFNVFSFSMSM